MFELSISTDFSGAHQLRDYPGKCRNLHGHNWRVEVSIRGEALNKLGMIVDFGDLKRELNEIINTLDHHYLNDLAAFATENPTSENIAKYIYEGLKARIRVIDPKLSLVKVMVWESLNSSVTYYGEESANAGFNYE